jgi:hypothetical protein
MPPRALWLGLVATLALAGGCRAPRPGGGAVTGVAVGRYVLACAPTGPGLRRAFLVDPVARRAWGERAPEGVAELTVRELTPARLRAEWQVGCDPRVTATCGPSRASRFVFDLATLALTQTLWDEAGSGRPREGRVVETLAFTCTRGAPAGAAITAAVDALGAGAP